MGEIADPITSHPGGIQHLCRLKATQAREANKQQKKWVV